MVISYEDDLHSYFDIDNVLEHVIFTNHLTFPFFGQVLCQDVSRVMTRTYRSSSRVNGWSYPPDLLQVIVWIAIAFVATYCFASLAPDFVPNLEYMTYGVSFLQVYFLFYVQILPIFCG